MKVSDQAGDNCLSPSELVYAIKAWSVYVNRREELQDKLNAFDKSGSGKLSKEELTEYLKSLNEGNPVTTDEVDWVMSEADAYGDGQINKMELVMATAAWFSH